jgi:hypothetical protein
VDENPEAPENNNGKIENNNLSTNVNGVIASIRLIQQWDGGANYYLDFKNTKDKQACKVKFEITPNQNVSLKNNFLKNSKNLSKKSPKFGKLKK